ncbi:MFS transporter [uncultured Jatrophihabitans sp.]|uniref:MFS transporter n=1 Tax=uncultured Jatrophihabitans sp. TaxID=1610747 RepID=UPI0035C98EDB
MGRARHLLRAWAVRDFRRLLAVRLLGQFGDGVFQASLAGAVLFDPQRQAAPADIAAGFAVVLLPYSILGPFAGVLLDRWSRQRLLVWVNVARTAAVLVVAAALAAGLSGPAFYGSALVVVSLSRFVLSALSAALPHVVDPAELVTANALAATAGAAVAAAGGGTALAARALAGDGNGGYATIAAAAGVCYLLAAAVAIGLAFDRLGPSAAERSGRETLPEVARGLAAGARHVAGLPAVRNALATIAAHRLGYGLWTVCTVLLFRNHFTADGVFRTGLAGLSQVVVAVAVGGGLAALATPSAYRRIGPVRCPACALALAAVVEAGLVLPFRLPLQLPAALLLAFAAQAVKISVDTVVQDGVEDAYRGRVFALYDAVFNVALVAAAGATAIFLPADGRSAATVLLVGALFAATALGYVTSSRRTRTAAR